LHFLLLDINIKQDGPAFDHVAIDSYQY